MKIASRKKLVSDGDAKKKQINALKQVARIWHCIMLGIVCFGQPHQEQVPPIWHCLDHLAMGNWDATTGMGANARPILSPFTPPITPQPPHNAARHAFHLLLALGAAVCQMQHQASLV